VNDAVSTDEASALSGDVLADNGAGADSDADTGDTLSVIEVNGVGASVGSAITLSSGATLTVNANGAFSYNPNGVFESLASGSSDTDSFAYTISDGNGGQDSATATVTISGLNDAPVAANDAVATDENTTATGDVLADNGAGADSDIDAGDSLTVTEVNGVSASVGSQITLTSGALLTLNANGTFSYDPNGVFDALLTGQSDSDSFAYTVSDGNGGIDTATVTVTIAGVSAANSAPVASNDAVSTDEDTTLTGDVLADNGSGADSDVDAGDTLSVIEVNGVGASVGSQITLASGATLTVNANGAFSYNPNGVFGALAVGASDSDNFTYTIDDGHGLTDTATVSLTIAGVNDAPVAANDAIATDEVTPASGDVLADNGAGADSDPDAGDTLTISEVDGVAGDVGSQVTLASGALLTLNANGSFSYDPNGAFESLAIGASDTDSFAYTVSDGNGGTDTATATVTISGVNAAPVAADDAVAVSEDATLAGDVLADNGAGADSDVDAGDTLTLTEVNGVSASVGSQITLTSGALLTVNTDGTFSYDPNGVFDALLTGQSDTDSFAYTVSDGNGGVDTATVTVTISGVGVANSAPVANDDAVSTGEDTTLSGDVLVDNGAGADSDVDAGDTLSISEVEGSAGNVGSQITLTSGALLTVNVSGSFDYNPSGVFEDLAVGASSSDSFVYTVSDGNGGSDTATVSVTITGANDAPTAVDDNGAFSLSVGDGPTTLNVLSNDIDPDGDALTITSLGAVPAGLGSAVVTGGGATISYTPGAAGAVSFTYTVEDPSSASSTATVTGSVVNQPPQAVDDNNFTVAASAGATVLDVLANDSDPNGDGLTVTAVSATSGDGTVVVTSGGGSVTYMPGATASETFTYTVSDGAGGQDTALVTVTVQNTSPVAVNDTASAQSGASQTLNVLINDSDPDGHALIISLVTTPSLGGNATIVSGGGALSYTAGSAGSETFSYTITDVMGATATALVTVDVTATSHAPAAIDDSYWIDPSASSFTFTPLDNDSDADGGVLTLTAVGPTSNGGTATLVDTTTISYSPLSPGVETFSYTVDDGQGEEAYGLVTVRAQRLEQGADNFAYDTLGRLTWAYYQDGSVIEYRFDANGNRTTLIASTGSGEGAGGTLPQTFFAVNNDAKPEGETLIFTVTRTGSTVGSHAVDYATANGTASSGDYTATSGTLTFSADQVAKTVTVATTEDAAVEANETLFLNLSSPTNGATFLSDKGVGTINNDDAPPVITPLNPNIYTTGSDVRSISITQLVDLNGHAGQITSFNLPSGCGSRTIVSGGQSVSHTAPNYRHPACEGPNPTIVCSTPYVVRDTSTSVDYSGTASIRINSDMIPMPPPPYVCP